MKYYICTDEDLLAFEKTGRPMSEKAWRRIWEAREACLKREIPPELFEHFMKLKDAIEKLEELKKQPIPRIVVD